MKNIGEASQMMLQDVGVADLDDLRRIGVVEVYRMVKVRHAHASINLLYSLQGALMDLSWREVPSELKAILRHQVGIIPTEVSSS